VEMTKPRKMWFYQLDRDSDPMGRIRAAHQLGKIGSPEAVDALARALQRERAWGVQIEIASSLGETRTEEAYLALVKGLAIKNVKARRAVVEALGTFRRPQTIVELKRALEAKDSYYVPAEANRAIGKVRSRAALATLKQQLKVDSWNDTIRSGALDGLVALNLEGVVGTLMEYTRYGEHLLSRLAAVRGLGAVGKGRTEVLDHLLKLTGDKNFRVQYISIMQLGRLGDPRAVEPLQKLMEAPAVEGRLKRAAEEAIREIREGLETGPDVDAVKRENEQLKRKLEKLEGRSKKAATA